MAGALLLAAMLAWLRRVQARPVAYPILLICGAGGLPYAVLPWQGAQWAVAAWGALAWLNFLFGKHGLMRQ